MKKIALILTAMMLMPVWILAQFAGGQGRGDHFAGFNECKNPLAAGIIKGTATICYNTAPAAISDSVSPSDYGGTLEYKWQSSTTDSVNGFGEISGSTLSSYTPGALTQTTWFRRLAKATCRDVWPETGISNVVKITVRPVFSTGEILTTGDTICYGEDPGNIGNSTLASGGAGRIAYRWQSSTDNVTFVTIVTGATSSSYNPPTGLTQTTWYRRQAIDSTCNIDYANSTGTWKVLVYPVTSGGSVTGNNSVCYGTNSTLLTLTGHTGSVVTWQYSTNNITWTNLDASTNTTYTAENLVVNTWYRAAVQSGFCQAEYSSSHLLQVFENYKIAGYAKYDNNPKTPLTGIKILLKKGTALVDSVATDWSGRYEFDSLTNGTFGLIVKSAHASGQWQTWGGVNMTDYLLVYKHATTGPLLPDLPPVIRVAADVKAPQNPPQINTTDATFIQNAAKYGWGNPPWFQIPKWVFTGVSPALRIDTFALDCGNVVRDIRGLCAADVNGSYLPGAGYKIAAPGLILVNNGIIPVTGEMVFPVVFGSPNSVNIGAITLILDYDPSRIRITGVDMPENGGTEPWFTAENGVLTIGWMTLDPMTVTEKQPVLFIHTEGTPHGMSIPDGSPNPIRFSLNDNPLSEIADADGNVIPNVKLSIPDAGSMPNAHGSMLIDVYPNPAREVLNIEFQSFFSGTFSAELVGMNGVVVIAAEPETIDAGWHKEHLDLRSLPPGIYFLRAKLDGGTVTKKVIVLR